MRERFEARHAPYLLDKRSDGDYEDWEIRCWWEEFSHGFQAALTFTEDDVERVARALWGARETPWSEAGKTAQKEYRRQAKAALNTLKGE